jgi:menaquinone-dependent protoporphyrinogen oxidase
MAGKILVTYATKYGSTEELAGIIAEELHRRGHEVDCLAAGGVKSVGSYAVVILGSPIYMGKLLSEAVDFTKRYRDDLKARRFAAFVVGYSLQARTEKNLRNAEAAVDLIRRYAIPEEVGLFAGRVDLDRMSFADKAIMKLGGIEPGDFRDFDEIREWTRDLMARWGEQADAPPPPVAH